MQPYLIALALATLPAFGNLAGGLLAEILQLSHRVLSVALHGGFALFALLSVYFG